MPKGEVSDMCWLRWPLGEVTETDWPPATSERPAHYPHARPIPESPRAAPAHQVGG